MMHAVLALGSILIMHLCTLSMGDEVHSIRQNEKHFLEPWIYIPMNTSVIKIFLKN